MEKVIRVFDIVRGDFAGSRYNGEIIREKIYEEIQKGNKVVLDFEGITLITQSFGDEIVGIFVRAFGVDFVKNNIRLINANDKIRKILNIVVGYSKNMRAA